MKVFRYCNTFSLLNFCIKNCSPEEVDHATLEIDEFLKGLESRTLNYRNELITYDSHILVHSPADRIKHGPLANISADGYEKQLRIYKKGSLSPNIRVETFVLKSLAVLYFMGN